MNRAGRALDGSAFREKTTGLYRSGGEKGRRVLLKILRNRDGEESAALSPESLPGLELRLDWPPLDGRAELRSLTFLCSGAAGWNEFSMELPGTLSLDGAGDVLTLTFYEVPEGALISGGKIRHKNMKISGPEALGALRNRRERILALTGWMKEFPNPPAFGDAADFERYWKPRLFPERVPRWRRPAEWKGVQGRWQREGDLRWNLDYSDRYFPEELRPLRNAGALLRDWEEASGWIYLEYQWEGFFASLKNVELNKIQ
ncbi:MAG: hypothetical protein LBL43_05650 [Treponema sp.]|jgi:hypothetical protein|nr:hypothetical protein [Treponema sp.]